MCIRDSPNGYHEIKPGYEHKVPRTAEEFEKYWLESDEYAKLRSDINTYKSTVDTEKTRELYLSLIHI